MKTKAKIALSIIVIVVCVLIVLFLAPNSQRHDLIVTEVALTEDGTKITYLVDPQTNFKYYKFGDDEIRQVVNKKGQPVTAPWYEIYTELSD